MQEVILVVHLLLALVIIGLVLIQRSSGGGLGVGGGAGGMGDFASARSTANALTKATTICALLFFATSISLAVIAKNSGARKGLLESYETPAAAAAPVMPAAPTDAVAPAAPQAPAATPEPPVPTQ
ncbi:MAG: preprotein translocase subunit SecG [Proteobacteria bacterium]|nr:preprotein translocase subunit SecG [Pseudomonadota bacterium]